MDFSHVLYRCSLGNHRNKEVIWIAFPKDDRLIALLRQHTNARWSVSQKCWCVPDIPHYRTLFHLPQKSIGKNALMKMDPVNIPAFERFRGQLTLKAYSPNTIRTTQLYTHVSRQSIIKIKSPLDRI